MGNWWLAASSQQCAHSCIMSLRQSFLAKHQITQVIQPPTAQIWSLWLLAFSKTKITFEREEISDRQWDSGKYDGAADGDWENCVRSQGTYLEGDWGVIVLCTIFLVSCIFFNKCLYFSYYMAGYLLDRPCVPWNGTANCLGLPYSMLPAWPTPTPFRWQLWWKPGHNPWLLY